MSMNMLDNHNKISTWQRAISIALLAQVVSFFFFSAALWMPPSRRFVEQYEPLTHNPWTNEIAFSSQTRHRILGPAIAHYLGIHGFASALIPVAAGTLMLFMTYLIALRLADTSWATWTTFLVATTQAFISSQTWFGYQDAMGGAAVAACFLVRRSWLGAVFLFLGMLAEERCAVAIPFIVIWHFDNGQPDRWKRGLFWSVWLCAAVAVWVMYYTYAHSHFLTAEQLTDQGNYAGVRLLKQNIGVLPIAFFESIRGGWIIIGYALFLMLQRKNYLVCLGCTLGIAAGLVQAGMVGDVSRTASVIWPMLLIAVRELYRQPEHHSMTLLKVAVLLNILSPCYQVLAPVDLKYNLPQTLQCYYPLPFSLARWLIGF